MARVPRTALDKLYCRRRHRDWHCIFLARSARHVFRRARPNTRASAASHHRAGASGSLPASGQHARAWSLSQAFDEFDSAESKRAAVRAASPERVAMIPQLLRLTAPEIVVALTGLLVLVLDLSFLRRGAVGGRFLC